MPPPGPERAKRRQARAAAKKRLQTIQNQQRRTGLGPPQQLDPLQLTPMPPHAGSSAPSRAGVALPPGRPECFFEDAIELSRVLELTLTGKEGGKAIGRVPMAGIPHHAAERYCAELIKQGYSVALCDQLETIPTKGALLKRDITRVLAPGTVLEEGMLAPAATTGSRRWWLSQPEQPLRWGLASADVSTGEVQVMQREDSSALHQQLAQQEASELLWAAALDAERPAWCQRLRLLPAWPTPFSPAGKRTCNSTTASAASRPRLTGVSPGPASPRRPLRYLKTPSLEEDAAFLWKCRRSCTAAMLWWWMPRPAKPRAHRHPAR